MHFLTLVFKNVLRRPVRSVLTALGVALAVATFVALVGLSTSFVDSINHRYAMHGVDLVVLKSGRAEQVYATLPEALGDEIARVPNVAHCAPMLFDVVTLDESDLIGVFIEAWHHDSRLFERVQVLDGRRLAADDRWAVMLGTLLAKNLQKVVGDELVIDGQPLEIIGVFETDSAFENGGALVLIRDLQELMDRQGQVTGFELLLDDGSDEAITATRIAIEALRDPEGKPWNLAATPAFQQAGRFIFIRMGKAMAWLTSLIAVLIGCIGVLNTMMMTVAERTHEIGVLRAMGWRKSRVLRMVMLEAFVVGLIGAVVGVLAGVILTHLLAKIPAAENVFDGRIAGSILLQGIAVALVVAVVGSIYPAYRAARQLPTEALRHE